MRKSMDCVHLDRLSIGGIMEFKREVLAACEISEVCFMARSRLLLDKCKCLWHSFKE